MDRWPILSSCCADCHRMSSCKKLVSCFPFGATSFLSLFCLFVCLRLSVCPSLSLPMSHCWERTVDSDAIQERKASWMEGPLCILYRIIYKVFYTSQKSISNLGCWTGCEPLGRQAYCFLCLVQCLVRIQCLNYLCQ